MDRTSELLELAESCLRGTGASEEDVRQLRQGAILRSLRRPSQFKEFAKSVEQSINDLRDFIRENQKSYLSIGGATNAEKDKVESEVGLFIKTCGAQIEKLKNSVAVQSQGRVSVGGGPAPPPLNAQSAAHYHGVVLILAERLRRVSQAFDKCRAARYKQMTESESWRKAARTSQSGTSKVQGAGGGGWGSAAYAQQHDGHHHTGQHHMQHMPGQAQAQTQMQDSESQALLDHLNSLSSSVLGVERTVREISTLNQMFSTAVLHQTEQIETIYMQAVESSHNVIVGNKEIKKTIEVNKSSSKYILVLLLVASLSLLFYDWFNS